MNVFNPIALRKAKIVCNFGLSECNRVNYLKADDKIFICKFKKNVKSKIHDIEYSKTKGQTV